MQRYGRSVIETPFGKLVPGLVAMFDGEYVRHDDAQAEIARLRAALDKEREACDEWRDNSHMHYRGIFGEDPCFDGACPLCSAHDARRSAEAQEPPR